MNIIQPYAKIMGVFTQLDGIAYLRQIESIARISHRSEDTQTEASWKRFIPAVVLQHGDWSVTEHCSITVEAVVDRGIQQEWTRHRIGAYTVESTRFVNYNKKEELLAFIKPPLPLPIIDKVWGEAILIAETAYKAMVEHGVAPQLARSILPLATASKMIITYNLRQWRHFFLMRTSRETHVQMKEVSVPLLMQFKSKIPLLYDDIIPESRQIDNMNKAH